MNAWKRAMSLHVVMPRFVAPLFREIILFVFPALKEMQISAAGFRALMWWKLLRITTTTASPVYTIPSEEDWRAWSRWTKNNFQHGALEHLTWRRHSSYQGNAMRIVPTCCHRLPETSTNFLDFLQNQILYRMHFPRSFLVPLLIVSARFWSQTMSSHVHPWKLW